MDLPAPGRAEQPDHLAGRDVEVHAGERRHLVAFGAVDVHQPVGADPRAPPRRAHSVSRSRRTPERRARARPTRTAPAPAPPSPRARRRPRRPTRCRGRGSRPRGAEANSGTIGSARCAPTRPQTVPASTPRSTPGSCAATAMVRSERAGDPAHPQRREVADPEPPGADRADDQHQQRDQEGGEADDDREPQAPRRRGLVVGPAGVGERRDAGHHDTVVGQGAAVVRARSRGVVGGEPRAAVVAPRERARPRAAASRFITTVPGRERGDPRQVADPDRGLVLRRPARRR